MSSSWLCRILAANAHVPGPLNLRTSLFPCTFSLVNAPLRVAPECRDRRWGKVQSLIQNRSPVRGIFFMSKLQVWHSHLAMTPTVWSRRILFPFEKLSHICSTRGNITLGLVGSLQFHMICVPIFCSSLIFGGFSPVYEVSKLVAYQPGKLGH